MTLATTPLPPDTGVCPDQRAVEAALAGAVAALPVSVRTVARHVLEAGGKRLRPLLTVRVARLLGCRSTAIYPLAAAVEMAHAATLLHDDVLDQALVRRGRSAAHRLFGTVPAVLAGDALLALANRQVAGVGIPALSLAFSEAIIRTAEGEILEFQHQGELAPLETYLEIIKGKTAWMLRMACEVGAIFAGAASGRVEAAAGYGFNLGIAFQIVDDALDFASEARTGKPEGGDVREGKFTPPLLLYVESLDTAGREAFVARFCAGRSASGAGAGGAANPAFGEEDVRAVVAAVRAHGCDQRARDLAGPYLTEARQALDRLTDGLPDGGAASDDVRTLAAVIDRMRGREA